MVKAAGALRNNYSPCTVSYEDDVIHLPNMLLIGAANRDAGKTTFACRVISTLSTVTKVYGVKVTAIRESNGKCPRGGEGCGVCSSLTGHYCITEETHTDSAKDTARLLAAGCNRVFWLQVLHEHMAEGLRALLKMLPAGQPIVCESNSLSRVVQPGLFLMLKRADGLPTKETAREALSRVNEVVSFDGRVFHPDCRRLFYAGGSWSIAADVIEENYSEDNHTGQL
jgi:hypothetical protein